jgi:hypothetical protein
MDTDQMRIRYAFLLAVVGLAVAAVLLLLLVFLKQWTASDTVAVVGLFTSVLGTLVGAFFGLQVGAAGLERERQERQEAQAALLRALTEKR